MDATTTTATAAAPAPATHNYLQLANEAYLASTDYFDSSIRKQVEAAMLQFQGVHPAGSKYRSDAYKTRSRIFRPKTRSVIRKNEASAAEALFSTADVVLVSPDDDEDPMVLNGARLMHELMAYRLSKSNPQKAIPWFLLCMGAYQDGQTVGAVISYQCWDRKKDKPTIELLPVENFRIDPAASWLDPINTSPYVIRLIPMYVKDVKARMKRSADEGISWKEAGDAQILSASQSFSDTTRQVRERGRTDSKEQRSAITAFTIVWVREVVMEVDGADLVWYTLGENHLLSDPVPIAEKWWHGRRPFVMGYTVIETHKINPGGVADLGKDIQAEINEVANQRIDNVKFAMNKRYFAKRGVQVDLRSLTRNVPGSVTLMNDPEKDVKVQETQDVTGSAYQEQDRLNLDFDEVTGAFSPSSIQSNRKLGETVGGLTLLSKDTNQVGAYQLKTFVETWVEPVLDQVMALEAHYETDEKVLMRAARAAGLEGEYTIEDVTLLLESIAAEGGVNLTVDVGMSATNPQERLNNFLLGMRAIKELLADGVLEKYGMDVGDVIREVFSKLGYKTGKRFFDANMDPALAAAQKTIGDLEQQLALKESPELVQAKIDKLQAEILALNAKERDTMMAAFEKAVRGFFAAHQTAQTLAAVPQLAPVADVVVDEAARMSGNPPTEGAIQGPAMPLPGITQDEITDPRTGIKYTPGGAPVEADEAATADTSPNTPANPSPPAMPTPGTGAAGGIETVRND